MEEIIWRNMRNIENGKVAEVANAAFINGIEVAICALSQNPEATESLLKTLVEAVSCANDVAGRRGCSPVDPDDSIPD